jgi:hypothetical protein
LGYNSGIMFKSLIFGLTLAFFSLQVAEKAPLLKHDKNDSASHTDKANQHNPVPQGTGVVNQVDGSESATKGQQKDPPATQGTPDYVAWGFWVNFGLTAITLLIAIAAVIQASAAKLGAKAMLRSERAWLLLDGEKIGMPFLHSVEQQGPQKTPVHCRIALKNCGNTPATAIDWQFELQLGDSAKTPPCFDIYKREPPKDRLTPFPIGQDSHGHASAVLTPQENVSNSQMTDIWDGKKVLWLCGKARYYDVFAQKRWLKRRPEEHYTFVCLRYICAPNGANGQWVLGGPSGYNKAT